MHNQSHNQPQNQIVQPSSTNESLAFKPEALLSYIEESEPLTVAADIDRALHHYFLFFAESHEDSPGLFDRDAFTGLRRLRNAILKGIDITIQD